MSRPRSGSRLAGAQPEATEWRAEIVEVSIHVPQKIHYLELDYRFGSALVISRLEAADLTLLLSEHSIGSRKLGRKIPHLGMDGQEYPKICSCSRTP
jgi:hypothetical protein